MDRKEYHREWARKNRKKLNEKQHRYEQNRRKKVLLALGGICVRCGNPDWRCMQIDHVNGGGTQDRKKFGSDRGKFYRHVYKEILAGSKDYQLLCANCNWKKRWERGEN